MSLINDALKRAQHLPVPPPPDLQGPQIQPVERHRRRDLGLVVPLCLAVLGLLALFFAWRVFQNERLTKSSPAASLERVSARSPEPAPQRPQVALTEAQDTTSTPDPQPATTVATGVPSATTPVNVSVPQLLVPPEEVLTPETNAAILLQAPAPLPPPLKLQALVYHPTRPTALVSGKTLMLGDRIRDLRVTAIGRDSVTLASTTATNILSLSE